MALTLKKTQSTTYGTYPYELQGLAIGGGKAVVATKMDITEPPCVAMIVTGHKKSEAYELPNGKEEVKTFYSKASDFTMKNYEACK